MAFGTIGMVTQNFRDNRPGKPKTMRWAVLSWTLKQPLEGMLQSFLLFSYHVMLVSNSWDVDLLRTEEISQRRAGSMVVILVEKVVHGSTEIDAFVHKNSK